jgi:hypothetical protein
MATYDAPGALTLAAVAVRGVKTAMADLITAAKLKERLGISHSDDDTLMATIITNVSAQVETYLNRETYLTTYTEYFNVMPSQDMFQLRGFPVTSITTVHNDMDWVYGADTLLDPTEYTCYTDLGILAVDPNLLNYGQRALKVVYVGGMAASTAAFMTAYPDVAEATIEQCAYQYNSRRHIGGQAVSGQAGQVTWVGDVGLLQTVKDKLDRHVMVSI